MKRFLLQEAIAAIAFGLVASGDPEHWRWYLFQFTAWTAGVLAAKVHNALERMR